MWTRIRSAALTVALTAASLLTFGGVGAAQQDSAQAADTEAWVGRWIYRSTIMGAPQEQTGRITFQLKNGKLTGEMDEDRGARRWQIDGVRVEHTRLTAVATQTVGGMLPDGTPGIAEDYRVLELQFKLEGDRFTGSYRARTIRATLDGRRP